MTQISNILSLSYVIFFLLHNFFQTQTGKLAFEISLQQQSHYNPIFLLLFQTCNKLRNFNVLALE